MRTKGALGILTAMVLVLVFGAHAEAQLPKQGAYSGHFGWNATVVKFIELEKDHVFYGVEDGGTFFNDAGSGFLHLTAVRCIAVGETNKGETISDNGNCVVTDKDGDKAFLAYKCKGTPRCQGDFQWTGGIGKYTGIKGNNTFHGGTIVPGLLQGYSVWKGEWQLP
jgi:hypothetical protein